MFFFLQEFKANKGSRETAPLKLPVDGLALLLPSSLNQSTRDTLSVLVGGDISQGSLRCGSKQKQNFIFFYHDTFYRVQSRRQEECFVLHL
jgi:hypothetical protein